MKSVLTIGYGRNLFDETNGERARLAECASVAGALHMIVFSQKSHDLQPVRASSLFLYPTNSRSRLRMLFDAYRIGSAILRTQATKKGGEKSTEKNAEKNNWVIATQDPFEAGWVGYCLHLRYGIPLQVQEHGDFFGGVWWRKERPINQIRYVFGKWLVRRADCVRVVSRRVAGHLVALGVEARKVTTLAVAADVAAFRHTTINESHNLRTQYPDAEAILLTVGRLVKEKNFALLIRAFKEVVDHYPKTQLVIIGSGPEEENLKALVREHHLSARVSFIPWTDDVASYMQSADIFVLCSYREGWGRVIFEAMAAGVPAVVTDVGCVGEVFLSGQHGIVAPVNNQAALKDAVEQLIVDPQMRRTFGETASRDSAAFAAQQRPYPQAWLATLEACSNSEKLIQ